MKFLIVFTFVVVSCLAAPAEIEVLKYDSGNFVIDGNEFAFEQSDGQKHLESAIVNNLGSENLSIPTKGTFSFTSDDGQIYSVTYTVE